jgi:hypothetical protein
MLKALWPYSQPFFTVAALKYSCQIEKGSYTDALTNLKYVL